jgi:hypothetical protein
MRKVRMTVFIEELEISEIEGTDEFKSERIGPICRRTADFLPATDKGLTEKAWEAEFAHTAGSLGKQVHRQFAINKAEAA